MTYSTFMALFIFYIFFTTSSIMITKKLYSIINSDRLVVNNLKEPTSFRIKESGQYEVWAYYAQPNLSSTRDSLHRTGSHRRRPIIRSPLPIKETYFGVYPSITNKKTADIVPLKKGSHLSNASPDTYDNRYLACKTLDYYVYLEKGAYYFERKHLPDKKQSLINRITLASIMNQYKQNAISGYVDAIVEEPVVYYIQKRAPRYLTLIANILSVIVAITTCFASIGLFYFLLKAKGVF